MLVVLQAVIDEQDAVMSDPVKSATSSSDGRKSGAVLTRPAISGASFPALYLYARHGCRRISQ